MRACPVALFFAISIVAGCDCNTRGVQQAHGILTMSPKGLDFGLGCLGTTNDQQLVLTNQGNTTVTIDAGKSGITRGANAFVLLQPLPDSIDPGTSVAVHVGFTPTSADEFTGQFTIATDADQGGTQTASLVGDGSDLPDVDFEVSCPLNGGTQYVDCAYLDFKDVRVGGSADAVARLENKGCGPLTVNELSFYPDPADPSTTEADAQLFSTPDAKAPFTLRGGDHRDVKVHWQAPSVEAQPQVRMRILSSDKAVKTYAYQGQPGSWDLGMFANSVGPSLLVDTDRLTFFDATTGTPDPKTFTLENTGSAALTGVTVTIQPNRGTTAFTLGAGDAGPFDVPATSTRDVTVTYTPGPAGGDSATVLVQSDSQSGGQKATVALVAGTEPELTVRWLDGTGAEQPPPVDFGQTAVGAKGLTRTVRLENTGSATLNVSSVTVPGDTNPTGSYSVAAFQPTAVPPGGHADVTVTFNDSVSLRNDTAKLKIVSDDPAYDAQGGAYEVDLDSENEPNFPPVPCIRVCAHPPGSTQCSTGPSLTLELTVDGSCSSDPENDSLTYEWALVSKPATSHASLDQPTNIQTRVVGPSSTKPDVAGNYVVQLKVTDTFGQTSSVSQSINVQR